MITKIQLHKNAAILATDGRQIGSLERVVVNPDTKVLTDIVVRTGSLIKRVEKVVPIEWVAETADDQILLDEKAGDLEALPHFEEEHIINEDGGMSQQSEPKVVAPLIPGYSLGGAPIVQLSEEKIVTRVEQNIPEGTIAMKNGAKVIAADGKSAGSVEGVFAEPVTDQITHLRISQGLLDKEFKLIPINWVAKVNEDSIHLRVRKSTVENLAEEPIAG